MTTVSKSYLPFATLMCLFFPLAQANAQDQNRALLRRKLATEIEKIASQFD